MALDRGGDNYEAIRLRARKLLVEQLSDLDLSSATVAADLGVGEKRLHRAFAADGAAVGAEIQSLRIEHAKYLLANTGYLVRFIARLTGYRSAAAFAKAFHRSTSLSPREWRSAKGGPSRAGGPSGAFYKPAERARARREGVPPPVRPITEPGSWAAFRADMDEAARIRARRRGESPEGVDSLTSLDEWHEIDEVRMERERAGTRRN